MTDLIEVDAVPGCNWMADVRRRGIPDGPAVLPSPTEGEPPLDGEMAYSPYQKRDQRGRFGSGGSSGTNLGVSRERPELGGGDVHTYGDLEAARKNPVIAKAERETDADLAALGIDVVEQRQVAGVFEGGGEPSLMLTLSKGTSLEDADIGAAYLVRRNEQDSVITNVMGPEMERLGLQPNGKLIRIEGLPTDAGSRERIFKEIQDSTPFASWDEKAGTVEVSYFDADLSTETRRGLDRFATEHGASMTLEPTHTRWTFHDDATRDGAREYLNPGDASVLRTAGDVIAQYPGDRTDRIGPVRGSSLREAMGGGGGAGPSASLFGDHDAGAGPVGHGFDGTPEGLTWAYSPGQKRDSVGRFGSGGGTSTPAAPSTGGKMTPLEGREALEKIGISADLGNVSQAIIPDVVASLQKAQSQHPVLFKAMDVHVTTEVLAPNEIARTLSATYNGVPDVEGYRRGQATIQLNQDLFFDTAKVRQTMKSAGDRGWLAGDTVDHAIQHEVGHVFDAALDHTSSTHSGVQSLRNPGKPSPYLEATQAVSNVPPSQYGKKSPAERFAEHYAMRSRDGKPTQYADSIIVDQLWRMHG